MLQEAPYRVLLVVSPFLPNSSTADPACLPEAADDRTIVELRRGYRGNLFTPAAQPQNLTFFSFDLPLIARALGAKDPAPYLGYLVSTPECGLVGGPPQPRFSNNHLGYAVTWFGLAAALLGVYAAMIRRPRPA